MNLRELIKLIRCHIEKGGMSSDNVQAATQDLAQLGYKYDYETFPKLKITNTFVNVSNDTPVNLAEALLWKLGKWKSYKKFCSQFGTDTPKPTRTDVVFYAFARHLKDQNNPIYDQHTLRALWAVDSKLNTDEINKIKNSLLDGANIWKQTMSGLHTIDCYNIYCAHINEITKNGASLKEIDLLLMPLGQAIKDSTKNYREFLELTGMNNNS